MKMRKRTYKEVKRNSADADRCVCCGAIIPEGTQVCRACMIKYGLV